MALRFVSTQEAMAARGLRAVVVGGIPSPWGEAAKGLFHVKGLDCLAVRMDLTDSAQAEWTATTSAPAVFWQGEAPVSAALDIVELAERIAPQPCLVPAGRAETVRQGISLLAGRGGLGWQRRLQQVQRGLEGTGGFHPKIARYLGAKYGHTPEAGRAAEDEVCRQLEELAGMLAQGGDYFTGGQLTALDIYSAAFMALFAPLPEAQCAMHPGTRRVFEELTPAVRAALDPALLAHRDRIYGEWLELPLSL
ncbi:hypothetical protein ACUXV3_18685 [Roseobacteraceae bacterium NS-SX3]